MRRVIFGLVALLVIVAVGVGVYLYVSGGNAEPSAEISSEQLVASSSSQTVFRINPEESVVRFILNEELRGQPTTVIGETNQVTGDVVVDFANPTATTIGMVRVNARTLETDNGLRNRAIRGQILQSSRDEFEFAEFTPTALVGLPETVITGQPFSFQIVGDLTVRDITQEVTFDATVTPVSENQLTGSAAAVVQRGDYNLTIPSVPGVANVSEEVRLELDFVANAVEA